jgi:iron complex transport system substrate-binding protein
MTKAILAWLAFWSAAAFAEVSAVDSDGSRVSLAAPAQRIVSLAPHVTELLFAAGAGAKVVAASEYSDYPEAAKQLPRVASSGAVDLERILALRPDLVVAWRLSATAQTLERLQSLGIPVFYSEPHRLAEIPDAMDALGVLAGTEELARPAASQLRSTLERLRADYRDRRVLSVFYQIAERPLMTVNGRQFISDALSLCGARNVFADLPVIAPTVSPESVLAADPDAIIAARGDSSDIAWQTYWARFGTLRAARLGNLITVRADEMHRHGPRALEATGQLCRLIDEARGRLVAGSAAPKLKAASPR